MSFNSFFSLPKDLILKIIVEYLPEQDAGLLRQTCSFFNESNTRTTDLRILTLFGNNIKTEAEDFLIICKYIHDTKRAEHNQLAHKGRYSHAKHLAAKELKNKTDTLDLFNTVLNTLYSPNTDILKDPNNTITYLSSLNELAIILKQSNCFTLLQSLSFKPSLNSKNYYKDPNENISAITTMLPLCLNLQSLVLSDNNIGDKSAKVLATALLNCPELQSLDLGYNNIGIESTRALVAALQNCPKLQSFSLGCNNVDNNSITAMKKALLSCPNIELQSYHLH